MQLPKHIHAGVLLLLSLQLSAALPNCTFFPGATELNQSCQLESPIELQGPYNLTGSAGISRPVIVCGSYFLDISGDALLRGIHFVNCSNRAIQGSAGLVRIENCRFSNCRCDADGGAIKMINAAGLVLQDTLFEYCTGTEGGAISTSGSLEVQNCDFQYCTSSGKGGAILTRKEGTYANSHIHSSRFWHCSSGGSGGAVKHVISGSLRLSETTFSHCHAGQAGGAIDAEYSMVVTRSRFEACNSTEQGGAIHTNSELDVTWTVFEDCSCDPNNANGGAIAAEKNLTLSFCNFTNCSAYSGGAVSAGVDQVDIAYTLFTSCQAGDRGGAVRSDSGLLSCNTCSFTGCTAQVSGAALDGIETTVTSSQFVTCSADLSVVSLESGLISCSNFSNCTVDGSQAGILVSTNSLPVRVEETTFSNCTNLWQNGRALFYGQSAVFSNVIALACSKPLFNSGAVVQDFNASLCASPTLSTFLNPSQTALQTDSPSSSSPSLPSFPPPIDSNNTSESPLLNPQVTSTDSATSGSPSSTNPNPTSSPANSNQIVILTFANFNLAWTGQPISVEGQAVFSGTLTLQLTLDQLVEGDQLILFTYASHVGQFDEIVVTGSFDCTASVEGSYGASQFQVTLTTITCLSPAARPIPLLSPRALFSL